MPHKSKITAAQLQKALKNKSASVRYKAIHGFTQSDITPDALPALVTALKDSSFAVVHDAIECLGKLGPAAMAFGKPNLGRPALIEQLMFVAGRADPEGFTMLPQL